MSECDFWLMKTMDTSELSLLLNTLIFINISAIVISELSFRFEKMVHDEVHDFCI